MDESEERDEVLQAILSEAQADLIKFYTHLHAFKHKLEVRESEKGHKASPLQLLLARRTLTDVALRVFLLESALF